MRKLLMAFLFLTFSFAHAQGIHTGEDVLRAMHDRYASSWYQTVTFTQKSTTYKPDGTSSYEMWYEAVMLPGKLRIDIGPASDGNGYVMVDGTATIVKNNQIVKTIPLVNILLVLGFDVYRQDPAVTAKVVKGEGYDVLGFDVYRQDPAVTAKVVKGEGYDLTKLRDDTWDGKAVYVVGAEKGDLKTKQFWVEKDSLLFVRVIEPARSEPGKLDDIRFTHYQPLAGAWIAAGVEVYSEGRKVFTEDYTDIQANVKLDPAVYEPAKFSTTHWEK